jgi:CRP-like cAMP-binding protein
MINPQKIVELSLFRNLAPDNARLQELAHAGTEQRYERGQILYLEGERGRGFYHLLEGRVRLYTADTGGKEQNLRIVRPGESFNLVTVVDDKSNPANAIALDNVTCWFFPTDKTRALMSAEPQIMQAFLLELAQEVRHFVALVGDISLRQVTARIARILLAQTENNSIGGVGLSNMVSEQMTQEEIAASAGTVRVMVGRALRAMQKTGAIEPRRGRIIVRDTQKLRQFLES